MANNEVCSGKAGEMEDRLHQATWFAGSPDSEPIKNILVEEAARYTRAEFKPLIEQVNDCANLRHHGNASEPRIAPLWCA